MSKTLIRLMTFCVLASVLGLTPMKAPLTQAETLYPYVQTFTISAYYSPCEGQERYAMGSYDAEIRMNGSGVNSADGTPVYPGMIAAPSTYAFGTKMSIPGIGVVAVHDRGGAIVNAGERGESYDRLDVWMGYCDAGLTRALNWGRRDVDVTVYGIDGSLEEQVYLEGFSAAEVYVKNVVLAPQLFEEDVWYLSTSDDVERLQVYLTELGYFSGEITGYYGEVTREAVYQFQLDNEILSSPDDLGAGHTGVNTRKMLDLAISRLREEQSQLSLQKKQQGQLLLGYYPDLNKSQYTFNRALSLGSIGDDVRVLQEELSTLGYLRTPVTGYYGEFTEHAVFKFQQKMEIVVTAEDEGAGVFGPQTRAALNGVVNGRLEAMSLIAFTRNERSPLDIPEDETFVRTLAYGERGSDVKELQTALRQLGFFNGAFLTEFYGEQTASAVSAFQLANNLIESEDDVNAGEFNETTRILLNSLT